MDYKIGSESMHKNIIRLFGDTYYEEGVSPLSIHNLMDIAGVNIFICTDFHWISFIKIGNKGDVFDTVKKFTVPSRKIVDLSFQTLVFLVRLSLKFYLIILKDSATMF